MGSEAEFDRPYAPSEVMLGCALRLAEAALLSFASAGGAGYPAASAGLTAVRLKMCSTDRLQAFFGLADACEADVAAQNGHGFKQGRRVLASAHGDADGLEHGAGF